MNIANIYRKLKQILDDSNIALANKGCITVSNLYEISSEIDKLGEINLLPYVVRREIVSVVEEDLTGITRVKDYAFRFCQNLVSVTIPDGVTFIGWMAFNGCYNLANIYLHSATPPSLYSTNAIPDTTIIHVPIGYGDAYKAATNWSYHSSRIVEDIEVL